MHFIHAVNLMRPATPELAELEATLLSLLEESLRGTERTGFVAERRALTKGDWTDDRAEAWDHLRTRVAQAVLAAYHRKEGCHARARAQRRERPLLRRSCYSDAICEKFVRETDVANMSLRKVGVRYNCGTLKQTLPGSVAYHGRRGVCDREHVSALDIFVVGRFWRLPPQQPKSGLCILSPWRDERAAVKDSCPMPVGMECSPREFNYMAIHVAGKVTFGGGTLCQDGSPRQLSSRQGSLLAPHRGLVEKRLRCQTKNRYARVRRRSGGSARSETPIWAAARGTEDGLLYRVEHNGRWVERIWDGDRPATQKRLQFNPQIEAPTP